MKKGISIIEMIVAIAIIGILSAVIWQIFNKSYKTYYIEQNQTDLQSTMRSSVDEMVRQIKKSSTCLSTYTNNDITYTASTGTNSDTLILKTLSLDSSGNIIVNKFDYYIYQKNLSNPNILQEIVYADAASSRQSRTKTLNQKTTNFDIKYYNSQSKIITIGFENTSMVNVSLYGEDSLYNRTNTASYSSSGWLRNY